MIKKEKNSKQQIYDEMHREKMKKNQEEVTRLTIRFLIHFPAILYVLFSAIVVSLSLAMSYMLRLTDWVIDGKWTTIATSYALVTLIFVGWMVFGVMAFYCEWHWKETYKKALERRGMKP